MISYKHAVVDGNKIFYREAGRRPRQPFSCYTAPDRKRFRYTFENLAKVIAIQKYWKDQRPRTVPRCAIS